MTEKLAPNQVIDEKLILPDNQEQYADSLRLGLEKANQQGFDILHSVATDYNLEAGESKTAERSTRILDRTVELASDLSLKQSFFDRPANTILLTAIADSWLETEDGITHSQGRDREKIEKERDMLVDVALILAGEHSDKVLELAQDTELKDRYLEEMDSDDAKARNEFFKSIEDVELANEVSAMFQEDGENSILGKQRERLGITSATEEPFEVRVLKYSNQYELTNAGLMEKVIWPDAFDKSEVAQQASQEALERAEANKTVAAPYEAAQEQYDEQFGEKYGPLAPAFVSTGKQGEKPVLYLMAHTAYTLVNYFRDGRPLPEDEALKREIVGNLAIAQHEYAHTQKSLIKGPHNQLGLLLEERKAELVSDDHHGYNDIKDLFKDISMATGEDLVGVLAESVKDEDALSSFVIKSANKIGLRNTLLLIADKPTPYEKNHDHARHFADLSGLKNETDKSSHDVIVRETLERLGDEKIRDSAKDWVRTVTEKGIDVDFLQNFFVSYREHHGSTHGTAYLRKAIEDHINSLENK